MSIKTGRVLAGAAFVTAGIAAITARRRYLRWKELQMKRLQAESQVLVTARGPVEYSIEGTGPVVMILHGTMGGYDAGRAYAHAMGLRGCTLLSLSRTGYLRTPLSSGQTSEEQADLYAATLDALDIPRAVLVAISGGGPSALQFALRYPDRCSGLIMISGLAQRINEEEIYSSLSWAKRLGTHILNTLIFYNPVVYLLYTLTNMSPQGAEWSELLSSMSMKHLRVPGWRNDMQEFSHLPEYPLQRIAIPTLILHGTADVGLPFAWAEQLAESIPQSQLHAFKGDHQFMISPVHRKAVQQMLLQFLQGLNASRESLRDSQPGSI